MDTELPESDVSISSSEYEDVTPMLPPLEEVKEVETKYRGTIESSKTIPALLARYQ